MSHRREEVLAAARAAFPREEAESIVEILDLYGVEAHERDRERVQFAIVRLSKGDPDRLLHFVAAAKTDYRDVLYWADHPEAAGPQEAAAESGTSGDPRGISPADAMGVLESRARASGLPWAQWTPAQGVRAMLEFYREVRAAGCDPDEDGDALLFQWGTYGSGGERAFQCDITRQFCVAGPDEDPGTSQLSLTFHFPPSPALDALAEGSEWCGTPDGLADFAALVESSPAWRAVAGVRPVRVTLNYDEV